MENPDLKRIECIPECGFAVQGQDDEELAHFIADHARKTHNEVLSEEEVRSIIKNPMII